MGPMAGVLALFGPGGIEGEGRGQNQIALLTEGLLGRDSWSKAQEDDLSEPKEVARPSFFVGLLRAIISMGLLSFAHCYLNLMEQYYHRGLRWLHLPAMRTSFQALRLLEPLSCTSNLSSGELTTGQMCRASGGYCSSDPWPWVTCPGPSWAPSPTSRSHLVKATASHLQVEVTTPNQQRLWNVIASCSITQKCHHP